MHQIYDVEYHGHNDHQVESESQRKGRNPAEHVFFTDEGRAFEQKVAPEKILLCDLGGENVVHPNEADTEFAKLLKEQGIAAVPTHADMHANGVAMDIDQPDFKEKVLGLIQAVSRAGMEDKLKRSFGESSMPMGPDLFKAVRAGSIEAQEAFAKDNFNDGTLKDYMMRYAASPSKALTK